MDAIVQQPVNSPENVLTKLLNCLLIEISPLGIIVHISNNSLQIAGYTPDELQGKNISCLMLADNASMHDSYMSEYKTTGIKKILGKGREVSLLHKNGDVIHCFLRATESANNDNYIGVLLDITELHETRLRLLNGARLTTLGELAAGIGHEINNPLASVVGYLKLMERRLAALGVNDSKVSEYFEIINDSTKRIETITSDMRVFTRRQSSESDKFQINKLIAKTIVMLRPSLVTNRIQVLSQLADSENCSVFGNSGRFQQVLINIIANARDALQPTPIGKKITVSTEVIDGNIVIKIKDNGCGIATESTPSIFNAYYTTKAEAEGTGIGLNLCQLIIKEFNGNITFNTKLGRGTSFYITVPYTESDAESGAESDAETLKGVKVLIVEDEPQLAELLTIHLVDLKADVFITSNGEEALKRLNDLHFDVVITDFQMPIMDGLGLIKSIKKDERYNAIKIILITGGVSGIKLSEAMAMADAHLYKPVDFDYMGTVVHSVLSKEN